MWPWIKRWRDWAMHDLWPLHRIGPQPQAVHVTVEKAGLTLHDQPIPWNAEAVLIEVVLRPPTSCRRKADFHLRIGGSDEAVPAESLRRDDGEDRHRLVFRLPPPPHTTDAVLCCKSHSLVEFTLPVLTREAFVRHLRLQMPTLCARLGDQSVACQTYVSTQCKGLIVSGVLTSPTSLVPLLDLGLHVQFRSERGGSAYRVPARLSSSQLAARQALVTVVPRRFPRRIGTWTATWMVADIPLATQRVRAISQRLFERSLRMFDTRFIVQPPSGEVTLSRHLPAATEKTRVGPCFLVASNEVGMAGLCTLQARAQVPGAVQNPLLLEQEVLITDGPTMFAPGTLDGADLAQVAGFELRLKNRVLGTLPLCPAPAATFTPEGGYKAPEDFNWSAAAEEELTERLTRLLEGPNR